MHIKHPCRILIAVIAACMCCACGKGYYDMTPRQFESFIDNCPKAHIIDVRSEEEYQQCHIRGAINISIADTTAFLATVDSLRKKTPFAVYCRSGVRSARASSLLSKKGYTVYNLFGGILLWQKYGMPVIQADTDKK